jgi:aspartate aminotransferase
VKVKAVTSSIEENFALPPIEKFEEQITERTRAIIICNPGNPTGYLYTKAEMEKLSKLVLDHDLFLIADEVYREFAYDGQVHHSVMLQEGLEDHAIMVDSVSKRYSMCGARIGCLATKNQQVLDVAMKFAQARLSPPTFAQIAAEAALDTGDDYFEAVTKEYVERRDTLIAGLKEIPGVKVAKPTGAFYCMVELPVEDSEDFVQWLLESFDLNGETIMVAPAAGFYSTSGLGKKEVRIAYVLEKSAIIKSVAILKAALATYNS